MAQHITQKSIYGIYVGLIIIFGLLYNIRHLLMFTTEKIKIGKYPEVMDVLIKHLKRDYKNITSQVPGRR